ncbi:DUF5686 and carboxypeptidase regulatory-like domain-containing protein [Parapedobacter indicus]|uniref:CarboxypepD_reg-like domain-containing protein n=1 Tax=Parapedobacter indicus TaxID=1477437 RepID=A0A1I3TA58_9SPHI|nr:DUF5686 and carboxypeptidase regulatory-like domain-containing protein [Parapedobacter indicus]PPK99565.1 carboxypeptidase-like protein [Parapedobacter indicus]SFJ67974.1 CarboxypepD_reg-like domain-containing protein [Parapedobacter indicus]
MLRSVFTLVLFVVSLSAHTQSYQVSGQVTDEQGNPVPFASIYKQQTGVGTAANSEGVFKLRLPAGNHALLIRAVGYRQAARQVVLDRDTTISVTLHAEAYMLDEVVIGQGEDPAYAIIRQAIRLRKQHLYEASPYTAHVYIKGVQRLLQAPEKFLGIDLNEIGQEIGLDSNRTGIVYLSESESRITVSPPDDFREEMISSKFSGNSRAFSFNRAADLKLNFYENHQPIVDGLSARPFVSPIADNALSYYRYRLLGTAEENGLTIHKIEVTPRRKAEPLYRGNLYIIEDQWRIYGLNLQLTKEAGINILDTLHIRQEYIPLEGGQWQPSSIRFDFAGGLLGFRVGGYFAAVYNDYVLSSALEKAKFNEVLRIGEGVNKRDSVYWAEHRPLPLTEEERIDYIRKDSLQRRRESKAYLDSVDRRSNRFKPQGFLLGGYTYRNRARRWRISTDGLATSVLFNTVEGLALNYGARYVKRVDTLLDREVTVYGNARYGFANKRFNGYLGTAFPLGKSLFNVSGGSNVQDLNNRGALPPLFNTISTAFVGRNYLKLYERTFATVNWRYTLPANVQLTASATWENRRWLPNSTRYTFWERNEPHLTSNNPFAPHNDVPLFDENQSFKLSVGALYDFGTKYETYPHRRVYLPSNWPTLSVNYTKGIAEVFGGDTDYDLVAARLHKTEIGLGMYGRASFDIRGGTFLNSKRLYYTDYRHFKGTQLFVSDQQLSTFLLLDYYRYSTAGSFVEAHGEYNLSTLLTSKVPLLRRLKLQEIIGVHYLHTSEIAHYGEGHVGLEWQRLRVMYARSFGAEADLRAKDAIRIGLRLF